MRGRSLGGERIVEIELGVQGIEGMFYRMDLQLVGAPKAGMGSDGS